MSETMLLTLYVMVPVLYSMSLYFLVWYLASPSMSANWSRKSLSNCISASVGMLKKLMMVYRLFGLDLLIKSGLSEIW